MTFNSQAWSNLSQKNISSLEKLQSKCLKKIVNAPQATANSFTYLELGVMPMRYEIERNQLIFLHHIVHLEDSDPVKITWENMKKFPEENNWWSGVKSILHWRTQGTHFDEKSHYFPQCLSSAPKVANLKTHRWFNWRPSYPRFLNWR